MFVNNLINWNCNIPYPESNLTRILKDIFVGNAKTLFILTFSPLNIDFSETLSTIRFGIKAKVINK